MKIETKRRSWYWARVGCIGAGVASLFVVFLSIAAVVGFLASGGLGGDEWDSNVHADPTAVESTLAAYSFLSHIQGEQDVRVKTVTPWTFTGSFGHVFVSYSVDLRRLPSAIAVWRDREDATDNVGPIGRHYDGPPAWWPKDAESNMIAVAHLEPQESQVHGVFVWGDESAGTFYVFFSWGH